jgi:hypothetical protein
MSHTPIALSLVAALASAARADALSRCRALVGGDYRELARAASEGECAASVRRWLAPASCAAGVREFEFRFMFEGRIHSGTGWCRGGRR